MKKAIKLLAVLIAVCFCSSALMMAADAAASDVAKGELFAFGMYPQTRVTDKDLIKKLNDQYGKNSASMIKLDGEVYAPYRVSAIGHNPGGSPFSFYYGYYPYDEEHGFETYWFRYEPIQWRVLDSDSDGVLLLSEQVLCTHAFNETKRADNTWENSDVRTWLNDTFTKAAFTSRERAYILPSTLANEPNLILGTNSGNDTTGDKVFLPSISEVTNPDYGFNIGWKDKVDDFGRPVGYYETDILPGEHSGRSTSATDFAKCQSVWTHLEKDVDGNYTTPLSTCFYWLRTAGQNTAFVSGVLPDGRVSMTGWSADYTVLGIRPMICVAPDAVADGRVAEPDDAEVPFHITSSADSFHYKQRNVTLTADTEVTWESSDPRIAEINAETGEVTIHRVGTVTITATSKETGEQVTFQMDINYLWWQQMIRIFLFGWIWY